MTLTKTITITETAAGGWKRETTKRVPVEADDSWSMFTTAGNKSLQKKAQRLIDRVEKLLDQDKASRKNVRAACVTFVAGWERMSYSKTMGEAGDTAVRECVAGFVDEICEAVFGESNWDLWDEVSSEAYRRVRAERNR
jgi:hypothetical protein